MLRETSASSTTGCAALDHTSARSSACTVLLTNLTGVRGLAGLLAPGPVLRPLLAFDRVKVREWATSQSVPFVEDPSNASLRHLRNRVRLELLPGLEQESPGFRDWLIGLGERAAAWRAAVAQAVDRDWAPAVDATDGMVRVARDAKRLPSVEEAALFWPDVAGRIGVALDRRGTARLAMFTTKVASGHRMPLSGGAIVRSERLCWTLERAGASAAVRHPPNGWHHSGAD